MSLAMIKALLLPKADSAAPLPPDFAMESVHARRSILDSLEYRILACHHRIAQLAFAAADAHDKARATAPEHPTESSGPDNDHTVEIDLLKLDALVAKLIALPTLLVRIRYIHLPKRALSMPPHPDFLPAVRAHNVTLFHARKSAITLLNNIVMDSSACVENLDAAAKTLSRLSVPALDSADFGDALHFDIETPTCAAPIAAPTASKPAPAQPAAASASTPSQADLDFLTRGILDSAPLPDPVLPSEYSATAKPQALLRKLQASNSPASLSPAPLSRSAM